MPKGYLIDTLGGWKAVCRGCAELMTRRYDEGTGPLSSVDFAPYSQHCTFCRRQIAEATAPFAKDFTDVLGTRLRA